MNKASQLDSDDIQEHWAMGSEFHWYLLCFETLKQSFPRWIKFGSWATIFRLLRTECSTKTSWDNLRWIYIGCFLWIHYKNGNKTFKNLPLFERLLERISWREGIGSRGWSIWRCYKAIADEASHLADILASSEANSETDFWCWISKCISPSWSSSPSSWQTSKRKESL